MIITLDNLSSFNPSVGDKIISQKGYLVGVLTKEGELEDKGKWFIDLKVNERNVESLIELEVLLERGYKIATQDEEVKQIVKEETKEVIKTDKREKKERKTEIVDNEADTIKKLIERDGFITNKSWREERRIFDSLKAGKELKKLVKKKKLRVEGKKKGMKYYEK